MRITCPQCGFFRELPENKVPVTSTMATCPKCRHRFRFRPELAPTWQQEPRLIDLHGEAAARTPAPEPGREEGSSWRRGHDRKPPVPAEPEPADTPEIPHPAQVANPDQPDGEEYRETPPPRRFSRFHAAALSVEPDPEPEPEPRDVAPAPQEPEPTPPEQAPEEPVSAREPVEDVAEARQEPPRDEPPARPDPMPEPSDADEPQPDPRPKRLDKDGVRDIWARLKAMDEPKSSRTARDRDDRDEDEEREDIPRETDPIPWERQDIYGFFPGLFLTLRQILLHPMAFFTAMPEGRPRSKALVFNLLISEFLLVIDFLWSLGGMPSQLTATGQGTAGDSNSLGFLLALLLVPPILAIGVFLDAWLTQLLLLLFRNARKNVSETFRVMCYSAAPMVLSAIPVAGQILSPLILVWYMALQAIGLRQLHQGGYTQILAAVFIKWSLYLFMVLAVLQGFAPR